MLAIIGVRAGIAEDEAADLNRDPVDILGAVLGTAMRVVGVVAAVNVLRGLPKNRTPIGAALTDTATEVTSGIAVSGTVLAATRAHALAGPGGPDHAASGGLGPVADREACDATRG